MPSEDHAVGGQAGADDFGDAVVAVIRAIPYGHVMSYGDVAVEAGFPGAARAVGNLLRTTPGLPWWRVVTIDGRLVPGSEPEHAARLRAEGVAIRDGRVVAQSREAPGRPRPAGR